MKQPSTRIIVLIALVASTFLIDGAFMLGALNAEATFKRTAQDEICKMPGFDIEFYKKLNPDDFSATDVPALRKLFESIQKQGGGDYRTFKLTVTEEPRQRPFEDLNEEEGARGGTWYAGARWRVNLHEDSLNDYLTVIVPKMQAVLSKVAVKTFEQDIMYTVETSGSNRLVLKMESATEVILSDDVYISLEIPSAPEKFLNPKEGDRIPAQRIFYTLPKAFGSVIPVQADDIYIGFYQHNYAKNGTYIASYGDGVNVGSTYSVPSPFGRVAAGYRGGNRFEFTFPSLGGVSHAAGEYLPVIQAEGQFSTVRFETDNYGGCLVSFREASDIFPEVKKKK